MVHTDTVQHGRKLLTVFRIVNALSRRAENRNTLLVQTDGQVVRDLSARRNDNPFRTFQIQNIQHALESQFVEIKAVAHVVVGRYRFGIVVNHHRTETLFTDGVQRLHTAPIELDGRPDTIGTRTQNHNTALVVFVMNVMGYAAISHVQIVRLRRILGSQRVYLFHNRYDTCGQATTAHYQRSLFDVHFLFHTQGTGYLEIRKALHLRPAQQVIV